MATDDLGTFGWTTFDDLESALGPMEQCAADLAGYGFADDAARETEEAVVIARQAIMRLHLRADRLRDIWRLWNSIQSSDADKNDLRIALAEYRAGLRIHTSDYQAWSVHVVGAPPRTPPEAAGLTFAAAVAFVEERTGGKR